MQKIKSMSIEEYHAHPSISKSKLDLINRSMAHFLTPPVYESTSAFDFGSAVHDAILLPEVFAEKYIAQPKTIKIRRGKAWDEFLELHEGKTILKQAEFDAIETIKNNVRNHPFAKNIFNEGEPEHSYFAKIDGVDVRCRPDFVAKNCVIDIKTTLNASQEDFSRSILRYRYHVQAAFYLDIVSQVENWKDPVDTFIFVAIEKTPPYAIGIYVLDQPSIDLGRAQYKRNLATFKAFSESGQESCTGYTEKAIQVIGCPNYAFYEEIG